MSAILFINKCLLLENFPREQISSETFCCQSLSIMRFFIWTVDMAFKSYWTAFLWPFIRPTLEPALVKSQLNEIINLQLPVLWAWREVYYNLHKQLTEWANRQKQEQVSVYRKELMATPCIPGLLSGLRNFSTTEDGPGNNKRTKIEIKYFMNTRASHEILLGISAKR